MQHRPMQMLVISTNAELIKKKKFGVVQVVEDARQGASISKEKGRVVYH
jgi:hypothetical protein